MLRLIVLVLCILLYATTSSRAQTTPARTETAEDNTVGGNPAGDNLALRLQSQRFSVAANEYQTFWQDQSWMAAETAIIVCDMWDYHHCFNAVRRMEQFVSRLDQVLRTARQRGVLIIHSPSDCMAAYQHHAARQRAVDTAVVEDLPPGIDDWCSALPAERDAIYPIDQSDGGEDDDPRQHAEWAAKLTSLGRDPNMPWRRQTDSLWIDEEADFISDRGSEVWSILTRKGIQNVILVGVHTNMCVLGRPFGLRQLVRTGKRVVLMRDMTDTMYNPQRWPYVSHFEGTRRIISHIERYVCPTISSDQILGGQEFRFAADQVPGDSAPVASPAADPRQTWATRAIPAARSAADDTVRWYRCVIHIAAAWTAPFLELELAGDHQLQVWLNGAELRTTSSQRYAIPAEHVQANDANLLVVRISNGDLNATPRLRSGGKQLSLAGHWQLRIGDDPTFRNMPLPAKFGTGSDIVFTTESSQ